MMWSKPRWFNKNDEGGIVTPYVHWWNEVENPDLGVPSGEELFEVKNLRLTKLHTGGEARAHLVPIPKLAANSVQDPVSDPVMLTAEDLPGIREAAKRIKSRKTTLVGVIDTGVPLSHSRTRYQTGETRILYSWQQSAKFVSDEGHPHFNPGLPFGQEVFAKDIEAMLAKHSGGFLTGPLDEDAFNRGSNLVEPDHLLGHRDLDRVASHGAHVLDLAAGYDPLSTGKDILDQFQIIAVNLPPQYVHGSAGNFLSFFAGLAVERLFQVADALWKSRYPNEAGGFPLVINFSFGQRAGAKAGDSSWERAIREMFQERQSSGAPTYLVMPAGNNNLTRSNARMYMENRCSDDHPCGDEKCKSGDFTKHRTMQVPWRLQPMDQTSNFIEVWAKVRGLTAQEKKDDKQLYPEAEASGFTLWVTPPGVPPQSDDYMIEGLEPGKCRDLGDIARVYCHKTGNDRAHFIICVAPTQRVAGLGTEAPAGLWNVAVRMKQDFERHTVTCAIQTDQSGLAFASEGRPSYFDHPNYEVYFDGYAHPDDRTDHKPLCYSLVDSYTNPGRGKQGNNENWRFYGPVQRKGTNNSLATFNSDQLLVIGGYQISDRLPAIYSATFDGDQGRPEAKEKPTATLPSHDTPAHFGLMAAGAKDGSIAYLQGTSMSSAIATRSLSQAFAKDRGRYPRPEAFQQWIKNLCGAVKAEDDDLNINGLKQGWGPLTPPDQDRKVTRLGNV